MQASDSLQRLYEELANRFARDGEARHRDHCLVLAADAALRAGQLDQAERLRKRLLLTNPHHLLRPFNSMAEAMQSSDVEDYVDDLRRHWPPEAVTKLLRDPDSDDDVPSLDDFSSPLNQRQMSESPARKTVRELVKPAPAAKPALPLTLGEDDLKATPAPAPMEAGAQAAVVPQPGESRLAILLFVVVAATTVGGLVLILGAPFWR